MNIGKLEELLNLTPSEVYAIYSATVKEHREAMLIGDFEKRDALVKELEVMRRILR